MCYDESIESLITEYGEIMDSNPSEQDALRAWQKAFYDKFGYQLEISFLTLTNVQTVSPESMDALRRDDTLEQLLNIWSRNEGIRNLDDRLTRGVRAITRQAQGLARGTRPSPRPDTCGMPWSTKPCPAVA
jgi:hypothetical protein